MHNFPRKWILLYGFTNAAEIFAKFRKERKNGESGVLIKPKKKL